MSSYNGTIEKVGAKSKKSLFRKIREEGLLKKHLNSLYSPNGYITPEQLLNWFWYCLDEDDQFIPTTRWYKDLIKSISHKAVLKDVIILEDGEQVSLSGQGELMDHEVPFQKLPYRNLEYSELKYDPVLESLLEICGGEESLIQYLQLIGLALIKNNKYKVIVHFWSKNPNTGKSTMIRVIEKLTKRHQCLIDLDRIDRDSFSDLERACCIYIPEIEGVLNYYKTYWIKKVTGDSITSKKLYCDTVVIDKEDVPVVYSTGNAPIFPGIIDKSINGRFVNFELKNELEHIDYDFLDNLTNKNLEVLFNNILFAMKESGCLIENTLAELKMDNEAEFQMKNNDLFNLIADHCIIQPEKHELGKYGYQVDYGININVTEAVYTEDGQPIPDAEIYEHTEWYDKNGKLLDKLPGKKFKYVTHIDVFKDLLKQCSPDLDLWKKPDNEIKNEIRQALKTCFNDGVTVSSVQRCYVDSSQVIRKSNSTVRGISGCIVVLPKYDEKPLKITPMGD